VWRKAKQARDVHREFEAHVFNAAADFICGEMMPQGIH
jgi:hypothetical protein